MRGLSGLAEAGHAALARGDLDELGRIIAAVWRHNQALDPHCSNPAVDALMAPLQPWLSGWKLAGAGGGGFAILLAKSAQDADHIRNHFANHASAKVVPWTMDP